MMKFAYADPPYIGQAKKLYDMPEVDHRELIEILIDEYPDGWALSASSPSLGYLLPLCPIGYRIGAWCKSFCVFKKNVRPAYAWEPVIYYGGRNPSKGYRAVIPDKGSKQITPKDFLVCPITIKKGLTGAKPKLFCHWVLDLLNFLPGDELDDLYPGTGIMSDVLLERMGDGHE